MTKTLLRILIIFCLGFAVGVLITSLPRITGPKFGYAGPLNVFSGGVTNSSFQVGVWVPDAIASSTILSRNTSRQYAMICNTSINIVYLHLTAASSSVAVNEGIPISNSSSTSPCYEIDADNLYVGAILGIANATTTVTTVEK